MAEMTTMEAAAYAADGSERDRVALPAALFDGTVNVPVMHQAVKAYLANQRQGNASTKTRGLVTGGNRKPWRQKGTGRARQGSIRAPHWVGGGTVFGPQPRSYAEYVPKQVRALARKSAFNARAREGSIFVIDQFEDDAPKTSRVASLVARLGLDGANVLILTDGVKRNVYLSGRNLPRVHVLPYADVSAYHLLWSDAVLMERALLADRSTADAESEHEVPAADTADVSASGESAVATPRRTAGRKQAGRKQAGRKQAVATSGAKAERRKPAATKAGAKKRATKKPGSTRGAARAEKGGE